MSPFGITGRPTKLREAAAIIFALSTILPLLVVVFLMWYFDLFWESEVQAGIFVALTIAILGFAVFRRLVSRITDLASRLNVSTAADTIGEESSDVPAVGNVGEIGEIAHAFGRLLNDLRSSTERLEEVAFKLTTLNEMVELAARVPNMQTLLDLVMDRSLRVARASTGSIMLLDSEIRTLHLVTGRGLPDPMRPGTERKVDESIAGRVVEIGEPVLAEDLATDPRFANVSEPRDGGGSFIGMPLRVGARIVGVLSLGRNDPASGPFSFTDLQFLSTLIGYAAYAVDNARLLDEAQETARRLAEIVDDQRVRVRELAEKSGLLAQLIDIGMALSSERDVPALLAKILKAARTFTRADAGTLFLREGNRLTFAVVQNDTLTTQVGEAEMTRRLRAEALDLDHGSLAGHVALSGTILSIPDVYAIERGTPFFFNRSVDERIGYRTRSMLVVPLTTPGGDVLGVLELLNALDDRGAATTFDPGYEGLVRSFAAHAAVVLTNARLLADSEDQRRSAEALVRLERIISSSLDTNEVLAAITQSAAELMHAPSVTLWGADENARTLRLRAVSGAFGNDIPFAVASFDEGVLGWIAVHRRPLHVPDVFDDRRILAADWYRSHGLTSFYGVPIVWQDSLLAVLTLNGRAPFQLTEMEQGLIDSFVAQAATALQNARLYEELRVTNERLERSQAELLHSEKLSALGSLIAGVAHELNNPLTVVLGNSHLLEGEIEDATARRHIESVRMAAERASEIVRNLLQFSRKSLPQREMVDVNYLVDRVLDLAGHTLVTRDIRLVRDLARDLPVTVGDPGQLQQVFLNLVTNAIQAMDKGPGVLTIRTRRTGEIIRVEVGDTGPGVPSELRSRIFDPFFTTKPTGVGTGLGLSVAHGVVTAHEGRIWLDDATTSGALMIVELPIRTGEVSAASSARPTPAGCNVLVVDDERSVGQVLADLLRTLGHSAVIAGSAAAARDALERAHFDLITLDLVMPGESGIDFWRTLVEKAPDAARRVVFVTGAADRAMEHFVEATGRPLLRKPFTIAALSEVLGRELEAQN